MTSLYLFFISQIKNATYNVQNLRQDKNNKSKVKVAFTKLNKPMTKPKPFLN